MPNKQNSEIIPFNSFGAFALKLIALCLKNVKKNSMVTTHDITLRTSLGKYLNVETARNPMPKSSMICIALSTTFTKKDSESKISPCFCTLILPPLQKQTSLVF